MHPRGGVRVVFATPEHVPARPRSVAMWRRLGVDKVVVVEAFTVDAIRAAARGVGLLASDTTALWLDRPASILRDQAIQTAVLAAFWRALLRPTRGVVIAHNAWPTSLRLVSDGGGTDVICRSGSGHPFVLKPAPGDLFVARLSNVTRGAFAPHEDVNDVIASMGDDGRLVVGTPLAPS